MSTEFNISFDWLPRESDNPIERFTLADICMSSGRLCITRLSDESAKTIRKGPRVSAYVMALWFAANWWRLRWEPERIKDISWLLSHKLSAAGGGYYWPDLSFSSDGEWVTIHNEITPGDESDPIRYLERIDLEIPVGDFEAAVDAFIDAVINRVVSKAPSETELTGLWADVLKERRDPDLSTWRKMEALMGFDPGEAPEKTVESILHMKKDYGGSAVEEMTAAFKESAGEAMGRLWNEARTFAFHVKPTGCEALRDMISTTVPSSLIPWQRAEAAAGQARSHWSIKSGPVTNKMLHEILSLREGELLDKANAPSVPVSAGFRERDNVEELKIFIKKTNKTGKRFYLARIIADSLITGPDERLLPACDTKTQRQKFQRAFAQAFLCPFKDLMEYLGEGEITDDAIEAAAEHFKVSPVLVWTTLVNKGVLDRDCLWAFPWSWPSPLTLCRPI